MAIPHAEHAQVFSIRPGSDDVANERTTTLVKTDSLEVIRLVLPAGKEIKSHQAPGDITVQCVEGRVAFFVNEKECDLTPGTMLYLTDRAAHSLRAEEDSILLVSICLGKPSI